MDWMGFFALVLSCYALYKLQDLNKIKRKIKTLNRKQKGESTMSQLMQNLKGERCIIRTNDFLSGLNSASLTCEIIDCEDEWVRIRSVEKGGEYILNTSDIETIEILSN